MRIAVVGAGISGLTFTAALRQRAPAIKVVVYERDPGPLARGYALGMNTDAGMKVLEAIGIRDEVLGPNAMKVTGFVCGCASVLQSRSNSVSFHTTSAFARATRDFGLRVGLLHRTVLKRD